MGNPHLTANINWFPPFQRQPIKHCFAAQRLSNFALIRPCLALGCFGPGAGCSCGSPEEKEPATEMSPTLQDSFLGHTCCMPRQDDPSGYPARSYPGLAHCGDRSPGPAGQQVETSSRTHLKGKEVSHDEGPALGQYVGAPQPCKSKCHEKVRRRHVFYNACVWKGGHRYTCNM